MSPNSKTKVEKGSELYRMLLYITLLSLVMYGGLFYLFLNKMLKLEIMLGVIALKFVLTIAWTYWIRQKQKKEEANTLS